MAGLLTRSKWAPTRRVRLLSEPTSNFTPHVHGRTFEHIPLSQEFGTVGEYEADQRLSSFPKYGEAEQAWAKALTRAGELPECPQNHRSFCCRLAWRRWTNARNWISLPSQEFCQLQPAWSEDFYWASKVANFRPTRSMMAQCVMTVCDRWREACNITRTSAIMKILITLDLIVFRSIFCFDRRAFPYRSSRQVWLRERLDWSKICKFLGSNRTFDWLPVVAIMFVSANHQQFHCCFKVDSRAPTSAADVMGHVIKKK